LQPGDRADIVRFTWSEAPSALIVLETIVGGATVYTREQ
jgi:hypothetical protein